MYFKKCVFKCLSDNLFSLLIISPTSVYLAMIVRSDFQDFLVGGVTSDFQLHFEQILSTARSCILLYLLPTFSVLVWFCFLVF